MCVCVRGQRSEVDVRCMASNQFPRDSVDHWTVEGHFSPVLAGQKLQESSRIYQISYGCWFSELKSLCLHSKLFYSLSHQHRPYNYSSRWSSATKSSFWHTLFRVLRFQSLPDDGEYTWSGGLPTYWYLVLKAKMCPFWILHNYLISFKKKLKTLLGFNFTCWLPGARLGTSGFCWKEVTDNIISWIFSCLIEQRLGTSPIGLLTHLTKGHE